jgi:hypothetical protein
MIGLQASDSNSNPSAPAAQPPEQSEAPIAPDQLPSDGSALSVGHSQPSTLDSQPVFSRFPGETPRAFSAFTAFFELGHSRSLPVVADLLGENHDTVKRWSSKFRWSNRIHSANSSLLQQQTHAQAAAQARQTADWSRRATEYREREWETAQKVLAAIQCFLDDFSDQHVEKMSLSQVSRAFQIASTVARATLCGSFASDEPAMVPIQIELTAALKKAYGTLPQPLSNEVKSSAAPAAPAAGGGLPTLNSQPSTI